VDENFTDRTMFELLKYNFVFNIDVINNPCYYRSLPI